MTHLNLPYLSQIQQTIDDALHSYERAHRRWQGACVKIATDRVVIKHCEAIDFARRAVQR